MACRHLRHPSLDLLLLRQWRLPPQNHSGDVVAASGSRDVGWVLLGSAVWAEVVSALLAVGLGAAVWAVVVGTAVTDGLGAAVTDGLGAAVTDGLRVAVSEGEGVIVELRGNVAELVSVVRGLDLVGSFVTGVDGVGTVAAVAGRTRT